ncbi:MAG TPA: hypothetical protein VG165_09550 [Solirubrobacteraceae bacterium]|jgi:hypothetical protein|nr:hypothetical protein [Solirubrobacteraceae bacterium]
MAVVLDRASLPKPQRVTMRQIARAAIKTAGGGFQNGPVANNPWIALSDGTVGFLGLGRA